MEGITDVDCSTEKEFLKILKKYFVEYHDLYVQSDALLLADVSENIRNMCLKICKRDAAKFLSATGLKWQAALKKNEVKTEILADIDSLLMV